MSFSRRAAVLALSAFVFACTHKEPPVAPADPERGPAWSLFGPRDGEALEEKEILAASATGPLKFSRARIVPDNDLAYWEKYDAVASAKPGETVRMVYYIYNTDHSSSYLNELILKKAKEGVKFRILLDLFTNYAHLDTYRAMENASGNIEFRFYGRPAPLLLRDVRFLTTPCDGARAGCGDRKWASLQQQMTDEDQFFVSLFMSGVWAKSATALKAAILYGQEIDLKELSGGSAANPTAAQRAQLKELLELVYRAQLKGDAGAKLKLALAMVMYKSDVQPILDLVYSSLPVEKMTGGRDASWTDWKHSTDFTHHKLLLVGARAMVNGGRNIENSYHMRPNDLTGKYNFIDTDFSATIASGGEQVAAAYDRVWNFQPMVMTSKELTAKFPNDLVEHTEALRKGLESCQREMKDRRAAVRCLRAAVTGAGFASAERRQEKAMDELRTNAALYQSQYVDRILKASGADWRAQLSRKGIEFAPADLSAMFATYAENVPFTAAKPQQRLYGATDGSELATGKGIHALWVRGLENACVSAQKSGKPTDVYLFQAYWLPPANLMRAFAKMMDGTWNCKGVTVRILTNSFDTTDLNVVNVVARYQTRAFFELWSRRKEYYGFRAPERSANFEMYEYSQIPGASEGRKISLHSKVMVLGDDLAIGSANADPRSYIMDTNNTVYLRGAADTAARYRAFLKDIIANKTAVKVTNVTANYVSAKTSVANLKKEDQVFVKGLIARFDTGGRLKPAQLKLVMEQVDRLSTWMYTASKTIYQVPDRGHPMSSPASPGEEQGESRYDERVRKQKELNSLLMLL